MTAIHPIDRRPPPIADDRVGAVEAAGVEYLPEDARDSSPRNLGAVFLGANLTWTNVVFGAFAILFGLSFWQTRRRRWPSAPPSAPWPCCPPRSSDRAPAPT